MHIRVSMLLLIGNNGVMIVVSVYLPKKALELKNSHIE